MAERVDAGDLKSSALPGACGFDSRLRHQTDNACATHRPLIRPSRACPAEGGVSPAAGARPSLEWAQDVARDPATIEVALLGQHAFVIHKASLHTAGVEGDMAGKDFVPVRRCWIVPCCRRRSRVSRDDVEVSRAALELAPRVMGIRFKSALEDVDKRNIVGGRMTGFEYPKRSCGFSDNDAAEEHLQAPRAWFDTGWSGVLPYGLRFAPAGIAVAFGHIGFTSEGFVCRAGRQVREAA